MLLHYILAWFPMVLIAIANGAVREKTYGRRMSELRAHQLSSITAVALFGVYIAGLSRLWPLASDTEAWIVGAVWVAMTVIFEFAFGRMVAGHSWRRLAHDYNFFAGRLWALVLVWIGTAPTVFRHL